MRIVNTTGGPVEVPKGTAEPVVNTSDILEPEPEGAMVYTDEPSGSDDVEVLGTLPADGWCAVLEGEDGQLRAVPLVCWSRVRLSLGELLYGIVADGNVVDPTEDVGDREDFRGYINVSVPQILEPESITRLLEKQSIENTEDK